MRPANRSSRGVATTSAIAALAAALALACGHAPPVRPANGHQDPDYPEINCDLYHTADCRPPR